MNLQQLRYFVTVAEEGTFTGAAKVLHVSQPGVSSQIQQLERELGQPLFNRSHHAVTLTQAGLVALPHAQATLAEATGIKESIDDLLGLVHGHVHIGAVISCVSLNLPTLLASFHEAYPQIDISLSEGITAHLLEALADSRIDLAFIGNAGGISDVREVQINTDPLVAVMRKGAELARNSEVSPKELANHRLIAPPVGTAMREQFSAACSATGVSPTIAFEIADLRLAVALAAEGLGVATVPKSVADSLSSSVDIIPIASPPIDICLSLAWREKAVLSPAARAMVAFVRRNVRELG